MRLSLIQELVSVPRFDRYLVATGNDSKRAIKLYKANLRVAKAFHPVLGLFEIILRNRLNEELQKHFNDSDWAINKKNFLTPTMTKGISEVENRLKTKGGAVTNSKIVADQNFSFWTEQFGKAAYKKLGGSPLHAFKNLPVTVKRSDVSTRLNEIRLFRNRINHNEPICFRQAHVDFSYAEKIHGYINEVLSWISLDAIKLTRELDSVKREIDKAKRI